MSMDAFGGGSLAGSTVRRLWRKALFSGLVMLSANCIGVVGAPVPDGGVADAGSSVTPDSGAAEAPDAGLVRDAGSADAGATSADAGSAPIDAGEPDAGAPRTGDGGVVLSWSPATMNVNGAQTGFRILFDTVSRAGTGVPYSDAVEVPGANTSSASVTGLAVGTTYYFTVVATNNGNDSPPEFEVSKTP